MTNLGLWSLGLVLLVLSVTSRGEDLMMDEEPDNQNLELVFLIHTSRKINKPSFQHYLDFMKGVIEKTNINSGKAKVAAVTYRKNAKVAFNFNKFKTKEALLKGIAKIKAAKSKVANLAGGLNIIQTKLFTKKSPANTKRWVIILTDANAGVEKDKIEIVAKKLTDAGVMVQAYGIGLQDYSQLQSVTKDVRELKVYADLTNATEEVGAMLDALQPSDEAVKPLLPDVEHSQFLTRATPATTLPTIPGREKCEKLTVSMCQDMPYNETTLPNLLGHVSQDDIALEIHQFFPLVKVQCSKHLKFFLCATYLPPCTVLEEPIPPCRFLCQEAKAGCEDLMGKFGFEWPDQLNCTRYPEAGLCVGTNVKTDTDTLNNVEPPKPIPRKPNAPKSKPASTLPKTVPGSVFGNLEGIPKSGRCVPITLPMCQDMPYKETFMPNFLGHETQEDARLEVHQYNLLVGMGCSKYLKFFLCVTYLPACTILDDPIPPCRSFCHEAKKGCTDLLRKFGFQWPSGLNCKRFPVSGLCVGESDANIPPSGSRFRREIRPNAINPHGNK